MRLWKWWNQIVTFDQYTLGSQMLWYDWVIENLKSGFEIVAIGWDYILVLFEKFYGPKLFECVVISNIYFELLYTCESVNYPFGGKFNSIVGYLRNWNFIMSSCFYFILFKKRLELE